jgi:uncharacterized YccA/Bax inhibitor family protein
MFSQSTSNPLMNNNKYKGSLAQGYMSWGGVASKTILLLIITFFTMYLCFQHIEESTDPIGLIKTISIISIVSLLVLAIPTFIKPHIAKYTAIPYAIAEGGLIAGLSLYAETLYPNIIFQAIVGTFSLFAVVLFFYASGKLRATPKFTKFILFSMLGIISIYVVNIIMSFFGYNIPFVHGNGIFGIGFSLFVVGIATLSFVLDFDFIDNKVRGKTAKDFEWYASFSLLISLMWLYMEVLRLLMKIRSN